MKKNFLRVGMMLIMASVTLTSCQEFWDDLFGVESTPSTPSTPSEPSEPEEPKDDKVVTETPTGAEATVEDLADITELLDQVKDDIAEKAKSGEEYEFTIKNDGLETTATDNTIEVPRVEDSNVNLNFTNGVSTENTLVVKAADAKSETPVEAVNALTITMPATTTGLNLELDVPETTVTLKAASGEVVYDEVVATTALNTLYIEKGVTIRNLRVKGGIVKVKEGGKAETYVYAPTESTPIIVTNDGVEPALTTNDLEENVPQVQDLNGEPYYFKNLKVIEGAIRYANVRFNNDVNHPLEKLTISNVIVHIYNTSGRGIAKVIEGDGEIARLNVVSNDINSWTENEKEVASLYGSLESVMEMKGVSLSISHSTKVAEETLAAADSIVHYLGNIPDNVENCIFELDEVSFRTCATSTGSIKGCKFEGANENGIFWVNIPVQQSDGLSSYKLSFTDCDFSAGFEFFTPPTPAPGEETTANEFYVTIAFNNCKLGDSALTDTSDFIGHCGTAEGIYLRFEINGTLYEAVWNGYEQKYIFQPVQ